MKRATFVKTAKRYGKTRDRGDEGVRCPFCGLRYLEDETCPADCPYCEGTYAGALNYHQAAWRWLDETFKAFVLASPSQKATLRRELLDMQDLFAELSALPFEISDALTLLGGMIMTNCSCGAGPFGKCPPEWRCPENMARTEPPTYYVCDDGAWDDSSQKIEPIRWFNAENNDQALDKAHSLANELDRTLVLVDAGNGTELGRFDPDRLHPVEAPTWYGIARALIVLGFRFSAELDCEYFVERDVFTPCVRVRFHKGDPEDSEAQIAKVAHSFLKHMLGEDAILDHYNGVLSLDITPDIYLSDPIMLLKQLRSILWRLDMPVSDPALCEPTPDGEAMYATRLGKWIDQIDKFLKELS